MPLLAYGEYRPDVSDYEGLASRNILNVIPRGDGYGPFPSFSAYTSALPAPCRGAFYALKSDGTVVTFAGTSTKLYRLNNIDFTWVDVSNGASSYSALSGTAQWQFAQTGKLVFATQAKRVLQVFDLSSSNAFTDALGAPPQAAYISVVRTLPGAVKSAVHPLTGSVVRAKQFQRRQRLTRGTSPRTSRIPEGGIFWGVSRGKSGFGSGTGNPAMSMCRVPNIF